MFSTAPVGSPPFWGDDEGSDSESPAAADECDDPELDVFARILDSEESQQEVAEWAWRELALWLRGKALIDERDRLRRSQEHSLVVSIIYFNIEHASRFHPSLPAHFLPAGFR